MRRTLWIAALLAVGCGDDLGRDAAGSGFTSATSNGEEYMDDDDFPGNCGAGETDTDGCDTDGTSSTGAFATGGPTGADPSEDACTDSQACNGGFCVAPYLPPSEPGRPGTRGPFACEFTCVPLRDDERWCADDAACCSPTARCTPRGYCIESD